jgi:hypothetical protein
MRRLDIATQTPKCTATFRKQYTSKAQTLVNPNKNWTTWLRRSKNTEKYINFYVMEGTNTYIALISNLRQAD